MVSAAAQIRATSKAKGLLPRRWLAFPADGEVPAAVLAAAQALQGGGERVGGGHPDEQEFAVVDLQGTGQQGAQDSGIVVVAGD